MVALTGPPIRPGWARRLWECSLPRYGGRRCRSKSGREPDPAGRRRPGPPRGGDGRSPRRWDAGEAVAVLDAAAPPAALDARAGPPAPDPPPRRRRPAGLAGRRPRRPTTSAPSCSPRAPPGRPKAVELDRRRLRRGRAGLQRSARPGPRRPVAGLPAPPPRGGARDPGPGPDRRPGRDAVHRRLRPRRGRRRAGAARARRSCPLVPTMLAAPPRRRTRRSHQYRRIVLGGAPLPPASPRARRTQAGAPVVDAYGLSETGGGCVLDGRPIPGAEVELGARRRDPGPRRDGDARLPLRCRRHPRRAAGRLAPDRRRRAHGPTTAPLVVVDRRRDLVISGGVNVSPTAVEQVLADASPGRRRVRHRRARRASGANGSSRSSSSPPTRPNPTWRSCAPSPATACAPPSCPARSSSSRRSPAPRAARPNAGASPSRADPAVRSARARRPARVVPGRTGLRAHAGAGPDGRRRVRRRRAAALRRPGAPRPGPALGPAPRARRGAVVVGGAEGHPDAEPPQPPGGANRGPPAPLPGLRGRHPRRPVRRGHDADLGPRHVRAREAPATTRSSSPSTGHASTESTRCSAPAATSG